MDNKIIIEAVYFAAMKHKNQRRKDKDVSPYINHPISVARIISKIGGVEDPEVLAAAILHDTIEDTETTPEELETKFGANIRSYVEEVSDDKSLPKEERKLKQIEHAKTISKGAALIKLGDKISNVTDVIKNPPKDWSEDRRDQYLNWAEKVINNCPKVNAKLENYFKELINGK